jgi:LPS sulfotransferase NodH
MSDSSLSLIQAEHDWLASLEDASSKITAEIGRAVPSGRAATPAEIASIIDYVQRCEDYFRSTYEHAALRLLELGHPKLFQRTQAIVADLRQSEQVYRQMHATALASQARIAQMQQKVSLAWVRAMEESMRTRQQVFDKHNRQWSANFNRTCVHCGYYLGDSYYHCDICPQCGRLLRGAVL